MRRILNIVAVTLVVVLVATSAAFAYGNVVRTQTRTQLRTAVGQDRILLQKRDMLRDGSCQVADGQDRIMLRTRDMLRDGSCHA